MSEEIAEIAVIARDHRDRKGKTLPLMNADTTDQEIARNPKIAKDRRNWKGKTLPLISTDNTDLNGQRKDLPRIHAGEH